MITKIANFINENSQYKLNYIDEREDRYKVELFSVKQNKAIHRVLYKEYLEQDLEKEMQKVL